MVLSFNLFIFITEVIMQITLSTCENTGTNMFSGKILFDSEYAGDVVMLNEDPGNLQIFLDLLIGNVGMLEMRFALSRCSMWLQDWVSSKPNLVLARGQLNAIDRFS